MDKEDALKFLGIYYGFRYYKSIPCENMLKELGLGEKLLCQIIFSSNPENLIERILKDLALFNISRREHNKDVCVFIKDTEIKNKCLDTRIKSLKDFW
jgi:hypothetical protein